MRILGRPGGSRRCGAASKEVPGGEGKPRSPERWPESSGRSLDDDFLIEAFSCQVWSSSGGGVEEEEKEEEGEEEEEEEEKDEE